MQTEDTNGQTGTPCGCAHHQPFFPGNQQAYVARYRGSSFRYFLLEGDKIASLLLISQGDRGFFVTICK